MGWGLSSPWLLLSVRLESVCDEVLPEAGASDPGQSLSHFLGGTGGWVLLQATPSLSLSNFQSPRAPVWVLQLLPACGPRVTGCLCPHGWQSCCGKGGSASGC